MGTEVQKVQLQGFLELVGKVTRKQHPGDVGLDTFHALYRVGKSLRLLLQQTHTLLGGGEFGRQVGG